MVIKPSMFIYIRHLKSNSAKESETRKSENQAITIELLSEGGTSTDNGERDKIITIWGILQDRVPQRLQRTVVKLIEHKSPLTAACLQSNL